MTPLEIYQGSNGKATKALYAELETLGPRGLVALNLFRACKCSERAKVYRGHGYKADAYARKEWSMGLLCDILIKHSEELGIRWGWKEDPEQPFHKWVLYVEIPTGQVSFHCASRIKGPDYLGEWDKVKGASAMRIVKWTTMVRYDYSSINDWADQCEKTDPTVPAASSPESAPAVRVVQAFLSL